MPVAQQLRGRPLVRDTQMGFTGLNVTSDPTQLGPTELLRADNAKFTAYGGVTKRLGTQRTQTTAFANAKVQGGYYWRNQGLHVAVCNGTLYTAPYGGFPLAWTQRGAAAFFSASDMIKMSAFTSTAAGGAEVLYIADGGQLAVLTAGFALSRVSTGGTPTAISYVEVQNNRLFGVDGSSELLYWSSLASGDDLGVPSTPDAGGNAVIRTFGESALQSLLPLAGGLVIFHRDGISTFTGWSQADITIQSGTSGLSADTGTIAPWSVVAVENFAFFVSDRGIYQIDSYGTLTQISKPIEAVIEAVNHSVFPAITVAHDKLQRQIVFNIPGLGAYVWNYRTQGWSGPWTGVYQSPGATAMWAGYDQSNTPIIMGGFADGFVRRLEAPNAYTDDILALSAVWGPPAVWGTGSVWGGYANSASGTPFSLVLQSRRLLAQGEGQDQFSEKSLRWIYVEATTQQSATAVVTWQTETYTGTFALPAGGGTWGPPAMWTPSAKWGGAASTPYRIPAAGRGKYATITIVDPGYATSVYSRFDVVAFDMGTARYGITGVP